MSFFRQAEEYLRLRNLMAQAVWAGLLDGDHPREAYLHRCVQAEYQISHSGELLSLASQVAADIGDTSNARYFAEHASEERDHHAWAVSDLSVMKDALGPSVLVPPVSPHTRRMIGHQYDLLKSGDYIGFFGYVIALEGFPGDPEYFRSLSSIYQIPINALSSPIQHAELDREHAHELFEHIEREFPSPAKRQHILEQAALNIEHITALLQDGNRSLQSA